MNYKLYKTLFCFRYLSFLSIFPSLLTSAMSVILKEIWNFNQNHITTEYNSLQRKNVLTILSD
jgi:hypothetical protein